MKKVAKKSGLVPKRFSKTKADSRSHKTYVVQHPIEITIGVDGGALLLYGFDSSNEKEQKLLGEDGEYCCWDAAANVTDNEWTFDGFDGPGGGRHVVIRVVVPTKLIKKVNFETY